MNQLFALVAILGLKVIAADECIQCGQVVAIFTSGYSRNELNLITNDKQFIVKRYQIRNPPFLNLYYDTVDVLPVHRQLSEQFASIIDIDCFNHKIYAVKKEHRTIKLMRLDLETGQTSDEIVLTDPDAVHLKSFVINTSHFTFYFQLADKVVAKNYSFVLNQGKIDLQSIEGKPKEFRFEFSKVTLLSSKDNKLRYAFLRDLDLYLSSEPTLDGNQTLDRYHVINLNRLTNCLSTLCAFKRIDGFIHGDDPNGTRSSHAAVLVNNNYFFVPDIININGSTPVRHFPHYDSVRFAFVCEVLFTIDLKNYCFRDKKFYKIEFVNGQFEIQVLVATTQNPFVDNFNLSPSEFLAKWLLFGERPVAVIKLFNKAAVLFPSRYTLWSTETKDYEAKDYENLFPNHDRANLIVHAFYDELTKRYLFVGSKFNFIYRHSQLNEHNQFYENFVRLAQPLYTNCVQSHQENPFTLSLILAIFLCFVLIILLICCIYCKHCRNRTRFHSQTAERALNLEKVSVKKKTALPRSSSISGRPS